ncbi:type II toxin-antitoxin system YafQ family toxin [Chlorobium sp. N1]|uniref:type II toxin-antitoxin system YafQ family toxin n=1 Tax=Chlorobium sp. N1 TaxID=2491138 RepID=UPI001039E59C|nr:type II toxin-antitoxin system YafQ family toxin [Chlorobium sp. N1]TCD48919.1 type II toxin-antitoxin system YafQ family toxin [Chlorobium sp. N1]
MRTIKRTNKFKSDYRRELSGKHGKKLEGLLRSLLSLLLEDQPLPRNLVDHPLNGLWKDCRDCHIKPDLVLIYRKPDEHTLELVRIGSHSELGL